MLNKQHCKCSFGSAVISRHIIYWEHERRSPRTLSRVRAHWAGGKIAGQKLPLRKRYKCKLFPLNAAYQRSPSPAYVLTLLALHYRGCRATAKTQTDAYKSKCQRLTANVQKISPLSSANNFFFTKKEHFWCRWFCLYIYRDTKEKAQISIIFMGVKKNK